MKENGEWKVVKITESVHRRCKALAALDGADLQTWISSTLENAIKERQNKFVPCQDKNGD
jgi:predicted HicB family RNase H-like nuclease